MAKQIKEHQELVGRTIAAVVDDYQLLIRFADGDFIKIYGNDGGSVSLNDDIEEDEMVKLGIITQAERDERAAARHKEHQERNKHYRRRQYEELKAEFEPQPEAGHVQQE